MWIFCIIYGFNVANGKVRGEERHGKREQNLAFVASLCCGHRTCYQPSWLQISEGEIQFCTGISDAEAGASDARTLKHLMYLEMLSAHKNTVKNNDLYARH